jgi:FhaA, N-terminal domain/FHA domain
MSLLRDIEQKIEGLFERSFRRAFRSSLQPVELARKLAREMEDHKTVSVSRVYVPNEFTVYLAPQDRASFASYEQSLTTELAAYLDAHARTAGLSLVAPPTVSLITDSDLRVGEFGISCRMAEAPPAEAAPAEAAQAEAAEAADPAEAQPEPAEGAAPVETPPPVDLPAPEPVPPAVTPPPPPRPYQPLEGVSGTQVISAQEARDAGLTPEVMTLVVGVKRHQVTKRVSTLGRSRDCDVVVPDPNASRVHAEIRHVGLDYYLVDMGSTNGTEVNGQVVKRHALAHGDTIVMGTTEIHVELA